MLPMKGVEHSLLLNLLFLFSHSLAAGFDQDEFDKPPPRQQHRA